MLTADLYLYLLVGLLLVFLSMVMIWPLAGLVRRLRKKTAATQPLAAWARRIALWTSGLNLIYFVGLFVAVMTLYPSAFANGAPPAIVALYCLPLLSAALALAMLVFAVLAWKNRYWSFIGRMHYSLVASAALVFIWFLNYTDLLGFRF